MSRGLKFHGYLDISLYFVSYFAFLVGCKLNTVALLTNGVIIGFGIGFLVSAITVNATATYDPSRRLTMEQRVHALVTGINAAFVATMTMLLLISSRATIGIVAGLRIIVLIAAPVIDGLFRQRVTLCSGISWCLSVSAAFVLAIGKLSEISELALVLVIYSIAFAMRLYVLSYAKKLPIAIKCRYQHCELLVSGIFIFSLLPCYTFQGAWDWQELDDGFLPGCTVGFLSCLTFYWGGRILLYDAESCWCIPLNRGLGILAAITLSGFSAILGIQSNVGPQDVFASVITLIAIAILFHDSFSEKVDQRSTAVKISETDEL